MHRRMVAMVLACTALIVRGQEQATSEKQLHLTVPTGGSANPGGPGLNVVENTYVIGPADVLSITVWKQQALSGPALVRPDGQISLPLVGDVTASGKTSMQLGDEIADKFKKFIQSPQVSVVVTQIHSKTIYLLGEVVHRGAVEMTPGMTLLQAIAGAGGLTDYANAKKMYVLRPEGESVSKIPVHYKDALKGKGSLNLALKPGDTIVVP